MYGNGIGTKDLLGDGQSLLEGICAHTYIHTYILDLACLACVCFLQVLRWLLLQYLPGHSLMIMGWGKCKYYVYCINTIKSSR